jgi:hypothetical protein
MVADVGCCLAWACRVTGAEAAAQGTVQPGLDGVIASGSGHRPRKFLAFCPRCHLQHNRQEHRPRRCFTYFAGGLLATCYSECSDDGAARVTVRGLHQTCVRRIVRTAYEDKGRARAHRLARPCLPSGLMCPPGLDTEPRRAAMRLPPRDLPAACGHHLALAAHSHLSPLLRAGERQELRL